MTKEKVFLGISGGVDSSVVAALLVEDGYNVTGVFIKVWEPPQEKFQKVCTWRDDRRDAMRVAAKLGIPFMTVDLSTEYKKEVVDYMIKEYAAGRTPNPDVMCNKAIKFGAFFDWAITEGADFVATGHYARIKQCDTNIRMHANETNKPSGSPNSYRALLSGKDTNKDQSYFLWNLRQEQLAHILFPVGEYEKTAVRALARKFDLPTAEKKDSQGLCFIGKLDVKEFLKEFIEVKPGEVIDETGKKIGRHDGVFFYTIGERHGFKIDHTSPTAAPLFVVGKDLVKNQLIVSPRPLPAKAENTTARLEAVNWITDEPVVGREYFCRGRYRQSLFSCRLEKIKDVWQAHFSAPQTGLAPGQSLVIYEDDICLGGGIIS